MLVDFRPFPTAWLRAEIAAIYGESLRTDTCNYSFLFTLSLAISFCDRLAVETTAAI